MTNFIYRSAFILATLALGGVALLFGQSKSKDASMPKFTELSRKDSEQLDQQRALIAATAKRRYGTVALTKTKDDLPVLQKLVDERAFSKSQTYELQCLGVAFGDVLASELPMRWVMVADEYGTDPTLRYKHTTINVNALTMISKRVERGEAVNLSELLRVMRDQVSQVEKKIR